MAVSVRGVLVALVGLIALAGRVGARGEGKPIDGTDGDFALADQFQATVLVTANQVDRDQDYPPRLRQLEVVYDRPNGRAKVSVVHGFDMGKTFIRRYDQKREYMFQGGSYPACERAHLGEHMPVAELPHSAVLVGDEMVDGVACYHWTHEQFEDRVHAYVDKATRMPVKAVSVWIQPDGSELPLMTYEFQNAGPIADTAVTDFHLPKEWSHDTCERNQAGFPYMHIFHHFVRF